MQRGLGRIRKPRQGTGSGRTSGGAQIHNSSCAVCCLRSPLNGATKGHRREHHCIVPVWAVPRWCCRTARLAVGHWPCKVADGNAQIPSPPVCGGVVQGDDVAVAVIASSTVGCCQRRHAVRLALNDCQPPTHTVIAGPEQGHPPSLGCKPIDPPCWLQPLLCQDSAGCGRHQLQPATARRLPGLGGAGAWAAPEHAGNACGLWTHTTQQAQRHTIPPTQRLSPDHTPTHQRQLHKASTAAPLCKAHAEALWVLLASSSCLLLALQDVITAGFPHDSHTGHICADRFI